MKIKMKIKIKIDFQNGDENIENWDEKYWKLKWKSLKIVIKNIENEGEN